MKRGVLLALGGVLATSLAGGGLTYALFTATADPAETEVTAGTVKLHSFRDAGDTIGGPMFYIDANGDGISTTGLPGRKPTGLWAPGDTVKRVLIVQNTGSLDAKLQTVSASLTGDEALAKELDVRVCNLTTCSIVYYTGSLWDLAQSPQSIGAGVDLRTGRTTQLTFEVTLPLSANNDFQGKSLVADFAVHAEQARNNP